MVIPERRMSIQYGLSPKLAALLRLLITEECVTVADAYRQIGVQDVRGLVYRLRRRVDVPINSQHSVGYWIDHETREQLAIKFALLHTEEKAA